MQRPILRTWKINLDTLSIHQPTRVGPSFFFFRSRDTTENRPQKIENRLKLLQKNEKSRSQEQLNFARASQILVRKSQNWDRSKYIFFLVTLDFTPLEPQSRFRDKILEIWVVCPQYGTAILKGYLELFLVISRGGQWNWYRFFLLYPQERLPRRYNHYIITVIRRNLGWKSCVFELSPIYRHARAELSTQHVFKYDIFCSCISFLTCTDDMSGSVPPNLQIYIPMALWFAVVHKIRLHGWLSALWLAQLASVGFFGSCLIVAPPQCVKPPQARGCWECRLNYGEISINGVAFIAYIHLRARTTFSAINNDSNIAASIICLRHVRSAISVVP